MECAHLVSRKRTTCTASTPSNGKLAPPPSQRECALAQNAGAYTNTRTHITLRAGQHHQDKHTFTRCTIRMAASTYMQGWNAHSCTLQFIMRRLERLVNPPRSTMVSATASIASRKRTESGKRTPLRVSCSSTEPPSQFILILCLLDTS